MRQDRQEDIEEMQQALTRRVACHEVDMKAREVAIEKGFAAKCEQIQSECGHLSTEMEKQGEFGVRREKAVVEFLKGTVGEIKGVLAAERNEREENRDRLKTMLQEAARTIASK
jgi:gas vesicle protein